LQYIGTELGEELSAYYSGFGDEKNGFRIVYNAFTYSYINDKTHTKINADFPVIGRKGSTMNQSRRRPGILQGVLTGFINLIRIATFRRPITMAYPTAKYNENEIYIVEEGKGFENGYAIVCLYGIEKDNTYDSLLLISSNSKLRYNYIDTLGNIVNNKKYKTCYPFTNGNAMVRTDKGYYLINEQGINQTKFKFDYVKEDENGYFLVSYKGKFGLLNPNYEQIIPTKHGVIHFKDGNYFSSDYNREKKVYEDVILYKIPVEK